MAPSPGLAQTLAAMTSPAASLALAAAVFWAPAAGLWTWPALTRGRVGGFVGITVAVGLAVFVYCRALGAARTG